MILIQNRQRKVAIDVPLLKRDVAYMLAALKYPDFDVNIIITTNVTIQKYNRMYRHKDKPTNVLSFPYHADLRPGQRIKVRTDDDKNLGDIIISAAYVAKEAVQENIAFHDRLRVLVVHSMCHLLGYDHIVDADWRRMRTKEAYLLKKL